MVPQYQGALAHSGGSDPVRFRLSKTDITDLDEFYNPDIYFYRDNESWATRLALNATEAREYMLEEGLESGVGLRGFVFSKSPDVDSFPKEAVAEAQDVTIPYPPTTSEARWTYDEKSGRYLRFTTGDPMEDFAGNQISAANVVIYFAEHQDTDIVEDSNGATSVNIIVNGFGTAWVIRDGQILKGNWETNGSQTPNFIFNDGSPIPLKPGNTWVQVVPLYYDITIDGKLHSRLGEVEEVEAEEITVEEETDPETTPEPEEGAEDETTPTATPIGSRATPTPESE
jgi:ketosteroid isomerase-like protein